MKNDEKVIIFTKKSVIRPKKRPKFLDATKKTDEHVHKVGGVEIPAETVRQNLLEFAKLLEVIVPKIDKKDNGFSLKAFDVEVGIDGKGKVGFLGTGAEAGGHATFTLRFERPA